MNVQRIAISLFPTCLYIRYNNKGWEINHTYLCADLFVCRTLTSRLRSETQTGVRLNTEKQNYKCLGSNFILIHVLRYRKY